MNLSPRFGLRFLLASLVLLALLAGWCGNEYRRHQRVARAVRSLGGQVAFDSGGTHVMFETEQGVFVFGGRTGMPMRTRLHRLVGWDPFERVVQVDLSNTACGDKDVQKLEELGTIEFLILKNTRITDRGMSSLTVLSNVSCLDLSGTRVTDKGLIVLGRLRQLRQLGLANTQVTAQGVLVFQEACPECEVFR